MRYLSMALLLCQQTGELVAGGGTLAWRSCCVSRVVAGGGTLAWRSCCVIRVVSWSWMRYLSMALLLCQQTGELVAGGGTLAWRSCCVIRVVSWWLEEVPP